MEPREPPPGGLCPTAVAALAAPAQLQLVVQAGLLPPWLACSLACSLALLLPPQPDMYDALTQQLLMHSDGGQEQEGRGAMQGAVCHHESSSSKTAGEASPFKTAPFQPALGHSGRVGGSGGGLALTSAPALGHPPCTWQPMQPMQPPQDAAKRLSRWRRLPSHALSQLLQAYTLGSQVVTWRRQEVLAEMARQARRALPSWDGAAAVAALSHLTHLGYLHPDIEAATLRRLARCYDLRQPQLLQLHAVLQFRARNVRQVWQAEAQRQTQPADRVDVDCAESRVEGSETASAAAQNRLAGEFRESNAVPKTAEPNAEQVEPEDGDLDLAAHNRERWKEWDAQALDTGMAALLRQLLANAGSSMAQGEAGERGAQMSGPRSWQSEPRDSFNEGCARSMLSHQQYSELHMAVMDTARCLSLSVNP
ncbi:hypothetical protein V8C86DRAFT_2475781 [Haematococcus lacustris]